MVTYVTALPAYGRNYGTAKQVREAWLAGKDFQIADMFSGQDGRYVNKDDLPAGWVLQVRYNNARDIVKLYRNENSK